MKSLLKLLLILFTIVSCKENIQTTLVKKRDVFESVYASGNIETINQYQVFSSVNGIITKTLVQEGELINPKSPLFQISNTTSKIQLESAELASENALLKNNYNKLIELKNTLKSAKLKWRNDSLLYQRKVNLYKKNVITALELETAELNYQNSLSNFNSAELQYEDLLRQLKFNERIAKNNSQQVQNSFKDFTVKSEIKGEVFSILKKKGEFVTPQTPIAIIGSKNLFVLKLQIDEYDIIKIKKGQKAKVSLDSYKGQTFDAVITKIYPIMNERSKTFLVDAQFINPPTILYPNLSVEANIIIKEIKNTLTVPRNYLIGSDKLILKDGTTKKVKTGLKNYEYVEIKSGVKDNEEIVLPNEN
jgi:HlyD family secretion protein